MSPKCALCTRKGKECKYFMDEDRKPLTKNYVNALLERIRKLEDALEYYKTNSSDSKLDDIQDNEIISTLNADKLVDFQYKDIFSNILISNSFIGEQGEDSSAEKQPPYLSSTALGFALPTSSLKHCSNYSLKLSVPLFDYWGFSFAGRGAPLYSGFTSMRFASITGPVYNATDSTISNKILKKSSKNSPLGTFYREIFDWFFEKMENSIPLIDKDLFCGSIESSLDHDSLEIGDNQHASISLINSIVAYYFLDKEEKDEEEEEKSEISNFEYFYNLAFQQVNEEAKYIPQIKTIQTLLLLSLIDMTRGNEISSSQLVARAVAISHHLGLHINSKNLIQKKVLSEQEWNQRELVFWSCFIIDKLRASVLGISPYLHSPEISVSLPYSLPEYDESKKIQTEILVQLIIFADTQCENLNEFATKLRELLLGTERDEISEYIKIGLYVSKASLTLSEWRRNMVKRVMYSKTKTISAAYLEVLFNTSKIVVQKQLVREPLSKSDLDGTEKSPIYICTTSAEAILKICESQVDISTSLFGFHFVYSLYIASLIFLFNCSSKQESIRNTQMENLRRALEFLQQNKKRIPVTQMYLQQLQKFHDEWI